jgi:hypothetical protein
MLKLRYLQYLQIPKPLCQVSIIQSFIDYILLIGIEMEKGLMKVRLDDTGKILNRSLLGNSELFEKVV